MSLTRNLTRPARHLTRAITLPFKALFVVGLCGLINAVTSPGHWWFQWVAFGMGIAVLVAWARAFKTLAVLGLLTGLGVWLQRRFGVGNGH